jgi:hypothetical protein
MGAELYEPSYSIKQFCAAENISEPTYYKLRENKLGPTETHYPMTNIVRITHTDRLAWQHMMKNPTGEHAEAVRRMRAKALAKGRQAARKAVQSPNHVSKTGLGRRRKKVEAV